jgi:hypothetical protein
VPYISMTSMVLSTPSDRSKVFNSQNRSCSAYIRDDLNDLAEQSDNYALKRRFAKIDRFSIFALLASQPLVTVAKSQFSREQIGIFIGNMLAGWSFGEKELRNLHSRGIEHMSAFQATAWFPAAAQGEITIANDLRGYSKTLSGGVMCGLEALIAAIDAIRLGKVDAAIVGASESLDADLATEAIQDFDAVTFGEGACFLLLTKERPSIYSLSIEIAETYWPKSMSYCMSDDASVNDEKTYRPFYLGLQPLIAIAGAFEAGVPERKIMLFQGKSRKIEVILSGHE